MSYYKIYRTDPYAAIPSNTVKITYDDEVNEKITSDEDLGIEELSLDSNNNVVTSAEANQLEQDKQKALDEIEEMKMQVLFAAQNEAEGIIANAKSSAAQIMVNAKEEGDALKTKIMNEGIANLHLQEEKAYYDAYTRHEDELNQVLKSFNLLVNETVSSLKNHDKEYIDQVEESLRLMAIQVAEKILYKQIEEDPLALSCLTFELLDQKKKSKHTNIVLSNEAKKLADYLDNELRNNEAYKSRDITVETRDMESGSVMIEHDGGTIDASIKEQLANLKTLFEIE